mmetsp:Transcript_36322/g.121623  ORF Transcript_36322/g.121623 Transcript_36322/m.121623 type:complete len:317 (-) Transcript_36322:39-989(-)
MCREGAAGAASCQLTARASRHLNAGRTAGLALACGAAGSAGWAAVRPHDPDSLWRAPLHLGLTAALSAAAAQLPEAVRRFVPPNVGCAIALLGILLASSAGQGAGGFRRAVGCYLDGAGIALMAAVQPAMVTLGLYAHTHNAVLRAQWRLLLALALLVAPALLFGTACSGRALGLPPEVTASLLPASTTTGLALTMPSGLPLIRAEWVAVGTAFNSAMTQVTLPALLALTSLQAAPAFARGVGIGCTAHVGGMAALAASGDLAAADAAACALVVVGVARAVLMQVPAFSRALAHACGGHGGGSAEIAARTHPPRDT